ncbi:MAG: M15 family metallopeptidase [Candidatus Magasanikbacteria bacterium]
MSLVPYTKIEIKENGEPMVDLDKYDFLLEPKYFQQELSPTPKMYLREGVAQKLLKVQKSLSPLRLKIWDAFRSRDVQNNIYQKYWQEFKIAHPEWDNLTLELEVGKFVSPPYQTERIPPHATGGTVDLTLADENGHELDMGTIFDHFGPEAQPEYFETHAGNPTAAKNRKILREAMKAEGFTTDQDEWWHFDYGNQMWALKSDRSPAFYGEANISKMLQEISAGGVVVNNDKVLVVFQDKTQTWALPKGHIDEGETPETAARREIYEEAGITDLIFIKELGSYTRGTKKHPDIKKFITISLFTTNQNALQPLDIENSAAKWVDIEEVADLLSYNEDKKFFLKFKDSLDK